MAIRNKIYILIGYSINTHAFPSAMWQTYYQTLSGELISTHRAEVLTHLVHKLLTDLKSLQMKMANELKFKISVYKNTISNRATYILKTVSQKRFFKSGTKNYSR